MISKRTINNIRKDRDRKERWIILILKSKQWQPENVTYERVYLKHKNSKLKCAMFCNRNNICKYMPYM